MIIKKGDIMDILDLSLTYHWYDEIASGRKKEEYREIKQFYVRRICDIFIPGAIIIWKPKKIDAVRFHRGQGGKTTMLMECKGISIGFGKPELGAPFGKRVFIIKLGKLL